VHSCTLASNYTARDVALHTTLGLLIMARGIQLICMLLLLMLLNCMEARVIENGSVKLLFTLQAALALLLHCSRPGTAHHTHLGSPAPHG